MTDRIAFAGKVTSEGRSIRGSVQIAGSRTRRNGELLEIDPAALVRASIDGLVGRWEHDPHKVLAKPTNGTLSLSRSDQTLDYEMTDLPNVSYANDALELVGKGYVTGSSFEIEGPFKYRFYEDPASGERVRVITHIKRLVDVSPVANPAFTNSTAAAFSMESEMTDTIEEPVAPAPAPEAPKAEAAKFTEQPKDRESYAATAKRMDTADLEAWLDNLASGPQTTARQEMYSEFAAEFDSRQASDTEARARAERIELANAIRRGKAPKAPALAEQFASDDYKEAFRQYLGSSVETFSTNTARMMSFAQTIAGDGTQGGFAVPDGFLNRIVERLKAYGGVAKVAENITTSTGESLRWPYNDDTGNSAAIATEATKVASGGADKVLDNIELGAFEYDATGTSNNPLELSLPLIQDAAFDVVGWIERNLATRIGRKQAVDFANGAGATEPVGLFTKTPDTMTATAVSLAIPEHILQVDAAYRELGNCRWLFSDATLLKVWQSQSTTNVPLIIQGGTIGARPEDTLWGYPVTIDPAAGTKVAFGDFFLGYIIRRVRDVSILVDPYSTSAKRTVAYHAWARADGNIQDPAAYSVSEWSTVSADT